MNENIIQLYDECLNHIRCGSNGIEEDLKERAIACTGITEDISIKFGVWFQANYSEVNSVKLKKSMYVNFKEHQIYIHGSDYHFTTLIEKFGKTEKEVFEDFINNHYQK